MTDETNRHTAIICEHSIERLRGRIRVALDECSGDFDNLVSTMTAICNTIMWEHADEVAAEYRTIINQFNRRII